MTKQPHKHAEVIKAWADGKVIEIYDGWQNKWKTIDGHPYWYVDAEYRVKPKNIIVKRHIKYDVEKR